MLKIYWKQTIQLLKQNTLISAVSIIGTALAITMIMVMILVQYINDKPMAPEVNRDRLLYTKNFEWKDTKNNVNRNGFLIYEYYDKYLKHLKTPELIGFRNIYIEAFVQGTLSLAGSNDYYSATLGETDANYWKIMAFDFIEGIPFSQADIDSQLKKTIIVESKAKEIFGSAENAIDKMIDVNFEQYQIIGVVKDVSPIFSFCRGDIFIPYGNNPDFPVITFYLAKDSKDFGAIQEEIREIERKFAIDNPNQLLSLYGPYNQSVQKEVSGGNEEVDTRATKIRNNIVFLILLLIPAINLSSFSMSQIRRRIEEIGIRKAYGATKFSILKQVLMENFITTLIGGVLGLLFSYIVLFWLRNWLLDIPEGGNIPLESFISPMIFFAVFCVCFLLNLLSAGLPAIMTLRMKIVDSLSRK